MDLYAPLFNYCERTAVGFWNEPLNAVSNIAFLIAAYALYRLYKHFITSSLGFKKEIAVLILFVGVIGFGSFLFHTYANRLAMLADVIPIMTFVAFYLFVTLRRLLGWGALKAVAGVLVVIFAGSFAENIPAPYNLNGSMPYVPCWLAILFIWFQLKAKQHPVAPHYLTTAIWFAASLTFRSLDMAVCDSIPTGTHFLWHTCNGIVLYLLTKALIQSGKTAN